MHAIIKINMDNAAFEDTAELARILREVADKIECSHITSMPIRDSNGNDVGSLKITV